MDKLEALILQNSKKKISRKSRFSIRQIIFLRIKTYSTVLFTILLLLFRFLVQWKNNYVNNAKGYDSRQPVRPTKFTWTNNNTNKSTSELVQKKLVPISTKTNEPRQHEQL